MPDAEAEATDCEMEPLADDRSNDSEEAPTGVTSGCRIYGSKQPT